MQREGRTDPGPVNDTGHGTESHSIGLAETGHGADNYTVTIYNAPPVYDVQWEPNRPRRVAGATG